MVTLQRATSFDPINALLDDFEPDHDTLFTDFFDLLATGERTLPCGASPPPDLPKFLPARARRRRSRTTATRLPPLRACARLGFPPHRASSPLLP